MSRAGYAVDPNDPRAPSEAVWARLSETERQEVRASLPSEIPRATPPEGDEHQLPKERAKQILREFFRRGGRSVYLGSELAVYYPDEPMFAPDLIAVLDVSNHPRPYWMVSHEGRGLDFALEIHVSGDKVKDYRTNVVRFARLGISEYFLFDPPLGRLLGYRLPSAGGSYEAIVPQGGFWRSRVLELDLWLDAGRLQFSGPGGGALLDPSEWIDTLRAMVDNAVARAGEQAQRAEAETQRADAAAERTARLEAKLRELGVDPEEL
jgi:Uma2 family endonuclease